MNRENLRQERIRNIRGVKKSPNSGESFIKIKHILIVQAVFCCIFISLFFVSKKLNIEPVLDVYQKITNISKTNFDEAEAEKIKGVITDNVEKIQKIYDDYNGQGGFTELNLNETNFIDAPKGYSFANVDLGLEFINPIKDIKITSKYGYRTHPISNELDFHTGLDLAMAQGSDIYAVENGTVLETGDDEIFGNYVKLSHSGGVETFYAHCESVLVKNGDEIKKGDVIAKVGSTGLSTGSHLHFEVKHNEITLDPNQYLLEGSNGI